jgi:hypothetical protein
MRAPRAPGGEAKCLRHRLRRNYAKGAAPHLNGRAIIRSGNGAKGGFVVAYARLRTYAGPSIFPQSRSRD